MATKVITAKQATSLLRKASTGKVKLTPKQKTFLEKKAQAKSKMTAAEFEKAVLDLGMKKVVSTFRGKKFTVRTPLALAKVGRFLIKVYLPESADDDESSLTVTLNKWGKDAVDNVLSLSGGNFTKVLEATKRCMQGGIAKLDSTITAIQKQPDPLNEIAKSLGMVAEIYSINNLIDEL